MLWPPKLKAPRAATPGPGLSSRSRASYGLVADVLRHAAERRDTRGRRPTLPDAHAFHSQCRGQRFPRLRFRSRDGSHELHDRGALAAEVREIDPQGAEEAGPAEFGAFKLVVPVVGAGEEAMHHADEAHATRARFDAPLGCDGRRASPSPRPARQTSAADPRPSRQNGTPCPGRSSSVTATGFPSRSSNSAGTNQDEMPGPVAMACQTSSGVPGTSTSTWMERRPEASFFTLMMAPWDRVSAVGGAPRPPGDARGRRGRIHRGTSKRVS